MNETKEGQDRLETVEAAESLHKSNIRFDTTTKGTKTLKAF